MQTTCPECRTTFRVSQDHLGLRRGMVRCGTCNAVFNAYDTLLPELESPPGDDLPESKAAGVPHPEVAHQPASVTETGLPPVTPVATEQAAADSPVVEATAAIEKAAPDILLEPIRPQPASQPLTWKFWVSLLLALLLAGLLALQAAYFLRGELVSAVPASRPALELLCRSLHCDVPLPRQLTQAAIAASSLEHDSENKSRVRLTLLLANHSGQAQAWPQIMLTLSDVRQAPVARQVFRPQSYLPKDAKISAGIAAGGEREIRLDLDIGNLVASGYALSLSYP